MEKNISNSTYDIKEIMYIGTDLFVTDTMESMSSGIQRDTTPNRGLRKVNSIKVKGWFIVWLRAWIHTGITVISIIKPAINNCE